MHDPKNSPPAASGGGATELPEDVVRRVDALTARLGVIDHYALLGLERNATRAQVRSAFLAVAPQFHPDKYFGKKLGSYAAKMQRVFAELSVAHDTLVSDEKRADYDSRLPPPPTPVPGAHASQSGPPASGPVSRPPDSADFGSASMRAATPSSPELDRARQQAFARRLAGSASRLRSSTPVPGSARALTPGNPFPTGIPPIRRSSTGMPAVDPAAAVEALRRRYEETKASRQSSSSHAQATEVATARAKTEEHAAAIARARDAEQRQEYGEAASHWAHACDLTPGPEIANRAAMCFRRAGADPRRAAKYGEEAVKLDPNKASYRANLALIYADAGLMLRARGEMERAQKLEPQNQLVKEALARLKGMK